MANTPAKRMENQTLEGVEIMWRNFEGREGQYNAAGDRNFVLKLSQEKADELAAAGWNVKFLPPREEDSEGTYFLKIKVKFHPKMRPPRVVMITSKGRTNIPEDLLMALDWADLESVDLMIRPYIWDPARGPQGVSAQLVAIYATIREDELELKYAHVPELEGAQKAVTADATPGNEFEDLGEIVGEERYALEQGRGF